MDDAYEAVFFDMDGVTVETADVWRELERTTILPAAVAGEPPVEMIRALSVADAYDRLVAADDVEVTVTRAAFDALYDEHATAVYGERAVLMDGYRALLADLRDASVATGLVSASRRSWVDLVLDRFDLRSLYDVVVSSSDVDGPSKPDPTTYLVAAEQLDRDPARCLVVEDSPVGIEAATRAGMECIAFYTGTHDESALSAADHVVDAPESLRDLLFDRCG